MGLLVVVLLSVVSCTGYSPPTNHYLLAPMEVPNQPASLAAKGTPLRVGIEPLVLPPYLDRPQMVWRPADNEVKIAQFDRWAEPLPANITRVLAENLSLLLKTDQVFTLPLSYRTPLDYRVSITIARFDATPGRSVQMVANWSVFSADDRSLLVRKKFESTKSTAAKSPGDIVPVLNGIVSDFSREIAATLAALQNPSPVDNAAEPTTSDAAIRRTWQGDYPVSRLNLLPDGQRDQGVGWFADKATFEIVWKTFKPDADLPEIDFETELVLFARNTQFYNHISIGRVPLKDGVAEIVAMETMSARPIEDAVAMAMAVVARKGITGLKTRTGPIPIP